MDGQRFDAVARALGVGSTRRAALSGLIASLLPVAAAGKRRRGDITAAGPCGNGGPIGNRCERPNDCCTRFCDRDAGRRFGRCRCRHAGQSCTATRNCCKEEGQQLVCRGRICRRRSQTCDPPCEPDQVCDLESGTCCNDIGADCSSAEECCGFQTDEVGCNDQCCLTGAVACSGPEVCCSTICCAGTCCIDGNICCGGDTCAPSCEA